jgi:hypothetical protein
LLGRVYAIPATEPVEPAAPESPPAATLPPHSVAELLAATTTIATLEQRARVAEQLYDLGTTSPYSILSGAVLRCCQLYDEFTADDYWRIYDLSHAPRPHEVGSNNQNKLAGNVMQMAAREQWCEKTGALIVSTQAVNHGSQKPVYRSLLRSP